MEQTVLNIQKNRCTVTLYINGHRMLSVFLQSRQKRIQWMSKKTEELAGVSNVWFDLSFYYFNRKKKLKSSNPKIDRKIIKMKVVPQESTREYRKRIATYSNKSPMGIASGE